MSKKTEELLDEVKDTLEDVADVVSDVADAVVDAAKPVVKKVKAAAKPAAQKAVKAGAEAVEAVKKAAPKKTEYYVQYAGREIDVEALAVKAKAAFKAEHKRTAVLSCRIYVKPEDNAAYYVINDTFFGRVEL